MKFFWNNVKYLLSILINVIHPEIFPYTHKKKKTLLTLNFWTKALKLTFNFPSLHLNCNSASCLLSLPQILSLPRYLNLILNGTQSCRLSHILLLHRYIVFHMFSIYAFLRFSFWSLNRRQWRVIQLYGNSLGRVFSAPVHKETI